MGSRLVRDGRGGMAVFSDEFVTVAKSVLAANICTLPHGGGQGAISDEIGNTKPRTEQNHTG